MSIRPLDVKELRDWLARKDDAPVVLDVREPWEIQICALHGAVHIPMSEIASRAHELPKDKNLVVVCHHGMRSLQVALTLRDSGFSRLYNLTGGIDAWAREVDPAMPTY